ncbi:LysR family transcriptional regulator [Photobacterium sp. 1_MG-2023]|uniref:LysR family transcriptional regulator n=1 Tax=Photobacterium sp. 1_MG-2023 TaxID=3062646 RepID=UPI0026E17F12|nr:LysR family transcriptional regulator [Photobacterium sp. 1_MG-2023]MDO6708975.1 LysR family transcriptional regulator [Photobacterium sp. 1_MG-2023]
MLGLNDIKFFLALAGCPNFSIAAKQLNVSASYVTQKLKSLEEKLGVSLIERHGRRLTVTEHGQLIIEIGSDIIQKMTTLEESLHASKNDLSGHLNILAPIGFGDQKLSSIVGEFKKKHPSLTIDLILSDCPSWSDYSFQPDIMFYIGELNQSSLYRMVISSTRRVLCASPNYLTDMPLLTKPEDLLSHNCIILRENNEDVSMWRFTQLSSGQNCNVRVTPSLTSNVADVVKQWALNGLGVINRSEWDVMTELYEGTLVELLPEYSLPCVDIVALMATNQNARSRRINKFLDFAKEKLQGQM